MVTNSTACVCICSVGTSTCWSWTVPFLWTVTLAHFLEFFPALCSTMATYSMDNTSLLFSSHHCCQLFAYHRIYWGVECLCAVISRYAPKASDVSKTVQTRNVKQSNWKNGILHE